MKIDKTIIGDYKNKKPATTEDTVVTVENTDKNSGETVAARELENKYKRALADYQNLEKRVIEEKKEWVEIANKDLLLKILPVLDTLMLAQEHFKDQAVAISISQFIDILKQQGVKKIDTVGKKFDPVFMEVVEVKKGKEGIVLEELRPGYTLYEKVLRAAEVIVGRGDVN